MMERVRELKCWREQEKRARFQGTGGKKELREEDRG